MLRLMLLLAVLWIANAPAHAAEEAPLEAKVELVVPPGAQAGPDFDVERATQAWIETLSPQQREKSDAYFEGGYWLQLWSFLYGLATAWLLLRLRWSAWMRDRAERWSRRGYGRTAIYALMYVPVSTLLALPLAWYAGFIREHQYGMATQTLPEWLGDQGKGLVVAMILGALFLSLLYWVFRRAPRTWWVWGTGVSMAFLVFVMTLAPVLIDPLFNDYKALPPGPLRDNILGVAHATGVPASEVYWFDASRQTKRISANVAGFGETTRIALNDNLLYRSSQPSIEAVMGHELGHYVLNHIYEMLVYFAAILLLGFALVAWSFDRVVARWGSGWGVNGIADPAGLPLLGALFSAYLFLLTPVMNTIVRTNEAEADRFGIAVSGQADGFAQVAMQLSEYRKISPGEWEEWLFYDHPSGHNRVRAAMEWKAEQLRKQAAAASP